jgi:hypothetical protein
MFQGKSPLQNRGRGFMRFVTFGYKNSPVDTYRRLDASHGAVEFLRPRFSFDSGRKQFFCFHDINNARSLNP